MYSIKFHSVGQGLFTSGWIIKNNKEKFNFIYDCGTSSSSTLLDKAILSLPDELSEIDLLALSHFDNDHINGIKKILTKYKVKTILIPMLSLEERIYIALENSVSLGSSFMPFYLDPESYILTTFGNVIDQIVLVPSASKNNERFEESENLMPNDDFVIDLDDTFSSNPKVKMLKKHGRIILDNYIEFIPYNDSSVSCKLTKSFENAVNKEKEILLNSKGTTKIVSSLSRIKKQYDKSFGSSAFNRNVISMFLYIGPVKSIGIPHYEIISDEQTSRYVIFNGDKNSVLYTGDGYLDTRFKLDQLLKFFGKTRISKLCCLQVMHHGASVCWHAGVAKALSPKISVFSSNPEHKKYKHPHAQVVRDFLPFNPIQVDKSHSLEIIFETMCKTCLTIRSN